MIKRGGFLPTTSFFLTNLDYHHCISISKPLHIQIGRVIIKRYILKVLERKVCSCKIVFFICPAEDGYYSMSTLTMNWLQNSRKNLAHHYILRVLCLTQVEFNRELVGCTCTKRPFCSHRFWNGRKWSFVWANGTESSQYCTGGMFSHTSKWLTSKNIRKLVRSQSSVIFFSISGF